MPRQLRENYLVIASHNKGKIEEISALLSPYKLNLLTAASCHVQEPEETGTTYLENALIKARACVQATNLPCLADDSGIEVEALGGEPGVYTAPYTQELLGREQVFSLWQNNPAIMANKKAAFVCVQVLAWPDGHVEQFSARAEGNLCFPPKGSSGHGYDPVFVPNGHQKTMAEMSDEEKNSCSHRFLALKKLIDACIGSV